MTGGQAWALTHHLAVETRAERVPFCRPNQHETGHFSSCLAHFGRFHGGHEGPFIALESHCCTEGLVCFWPLLLCTQKKT